MKKSKNNLFTKTSKFFFSKHYLISIKPKQYWIPFKFGRKLKIQIFRTRNLDNDILLLYITR